MCMGKLCCSSFYTWLLLCHAIFQFLNFHVNKSNLKPFHFTLQDFPNSQVSQGALEKLFKFKLVFSFARNKNVNLFPLCVKKLTLASHP